MPGLASSAPPTSCLVADDAGAADCLPPCWARRPANAVRAAAAPAACGIAARLTETASPASMAAGLLSRDLISDRPLFPPRRRQGRPSGWPGLSVKGLFASAWILSVTFPAPAVAHTRHNHGLWRIPENLGEPLRKFESGRNGGHFRQRCAACWSVLVGRVQTGARPGPGIGAWW